MASLTSYITMAIAITSIDMAELLVDYSVAILEESTMGRNL